jgi:Cu+-exporting ATPase
MEDNVNSIKLTVSDMSCDGCVNAVRSALSRVAGVQEVSVSLDDLTAHVVYSGDVSVADLSSAVRDAGYTPEPAQ